MKIKAVQKTTLIDYPGEIASIIYLQGCNFNCGYCYNKALIPLEGGPYLSVEDVIIELERRKHLISHVVVTGGEPTIHEDLPWFLNWLNLIGLKVKLDTNGSNPEMLKRLIEEKLVDYIAMDYKADGIYKYDIITGGRRTFRAIKESVKLIQESGIDHEFRTVVWEGNNDLNYKILGKSKHFVRDRVYEKESKEDNL